MKLSYPAAHESSKLTDSLLAIKIARHSPCSTCDSCGGLYPPSDVELILDDTTNKSSLGDLGQYGSDEEDGASAYIDSCRCGHAIKDHGADQSELGRQEFARRGRVAIRLDELLQDVGKLLNFDHTDEDVISLRRQMRIPVSSVSPSTNIHIGHILQNLPLSPSSSDLSDASQPPSKKRRISSSSLSDAEDGEDDEDEDRPLATRMSLKTSGNRSSEKSSSRATNSIAGQRSGKKQKSIGSKKTKPPSHTAQAHTAPTSLAPPTGRQQAEMNGSKYHNGVHDPVLAGHETKIKVEDKMDERQLSRLTTGVTVDTGPASAAPPGGIKTEKAATIELRKGIIKVTPVENDKNPRSIVILTGLKTLFQKQLPKMPREYIARLVYDSNSKALAIIKRGLKVVGGICYRPFPHRGFAEIVFFATASVDQVKGYGGMLMDHFKSHIRKTYPSMNHFLTYADNYAVGYFEKQGFSKDITLDRSVWAGYIKDYEGGTIMQCTMVRKVDYLNKAEIIARQREAILVKIREKGRAHIVYPGLTQWEGAGEGVVVDPKDVPGLRESGWTPSMIVAAPRPIPKNPDHSFMEHLLKELQGHSQAWAFLKPVNGDEVPDYYDVIKHPMDFTTMEHKLETNQYDSLDSFVVDAQLVFDNCRVYNPEGSVYHKSATRLEKFLRDLLAARMKGE